MWIVKMTFGWYQLKLLGALLGIFEFKFLFWLQSSNVTGRFLQVKNSNILLKEKWIHKRNEHRFPQKKKCGWLTATMNCNLICNYYNLLTMVSHFLDYNLTLSIWHTYNLSKNSKYFFTFFIGTVTEFFKTLTLTIYMDSWITRLQIM
jgi:hypothetical protein